MSWKDKNCLSQLPGFWMEAEEEEEEAGRPCFIAKSVVQSERISLSWNTKIWQLSCQLLQLGNGLKAPWKIESLIMFSIYSRWEPQGENLLLLSARLPQTGALHMWWITVHPQQYAYWNDWNCNLMHLEGPKLGKVSAWCLPHILAPLFPFLRGRKIHCLGIGLPESLCVGHSHIINNISNFLAASSKMV